MEEVKIKDNETGLRVYINGLPNIRLMAIEELNLLISGLEVQMTNYLNRKRTHKQHPKITFGKNLENF